VTPTPTDEDAPSATPTQTSTPGPTSAPLTAEDYEFYLSQILPQVELLTGLSEEAFRKAWDDEAYSNALREKMMEAVQIEVDDTKTLVHAAHILVATEEEALTALERIENGEDFEAVAADLSTDGSAPRGGDLGWFGRGEMIAEFEEVAFSVPEGEISQPVESQFGWHIIKVYEKAEVPATEADKDAQRREKFLELLQTWREESGATVFDDVLQEYLPELPK
jgi:parvulin-like peptidyl-prolyl isomerase